VIKSRITRWEGHLARMEGRRGGYSVLVEKSEEKRPLGRPKRRWGHNIEKDPGKEVGWWYGLDLSGSGQGQIAGSCECGNEPSRSLKFGEFLD